MLLIWNITISIREVNLLWTDSSLSLPVCLCCGRRPGRGTQLMIERGHDQIDGNYSQGEQGSGLKSAKLR